MSHSYHIKSAVPVALQSALLRLRALLRMGSARPLSSRHGEGMMFIVGSGRSGSTLLRSMLVAGGDICIPPESYVLPRIIALYQAYGFLPWPQLASLVIGEFEAHPQFGTWKTSLDGPHRLARELPPARQTLEDVVELVYNAHRDQHFPAARLIGDKTPINSIFLDRIHKVYPRAYYLHILRDPRACVASYRQADMRSLGDAIDFWNTATRNCLRLEEKIDAARFLRIDYEDLVASPEATLRRVCAMLDIDFRGEMLSFWQRPDQLGDVVAHAHHANVTSPLQRNSVDAWKSTLSGSELATVERATLALYERARRRQSPLPRGQR